jgi:hypothetical protein
MCTWIWTVERKVDFLNGVVGEQMQLSIQRGEDKALIEDIAYKTKHFSEITSLATKISGKNVSIRECCQSFSENSATECGKFFEERYRVRIRLKGMENIAELVFGVEAKKAVQKFLETDLKKNGEACPSIPFKSSGNRYEDVYGGEREELVDFFINNIRKDQKKLRGEAFADE